MNEMLTGLITGAVVTAGLVWALRRRHSARGRGPHTRVFSTLEEMRAIGELSVFKVYTKEIVTAVDHSLGEIGKRYFQWIVSSRKMAMIISFDIDFRYDLRSESFSMERTPGGAVKLVMPKCFYETHIRDILFYDEQNSKLLPWLLPDLLNRAFSGAFSESDKNRLIEEAKEQASLQARDLVLRMRSDVQESARRTLATLARGFGVPEIQVDFRDAELVQLRVEYDSSSVSETEQALAS